MHDYKVNIIRVVDGDTVDVDVNLGFGIWLRGERIRLHGIDAPECRTKDPEEKKYGFMAKDYLTDKLKNTPITLRTYRDSRGKFGRILGELLYTTSNSVEICINQSMVAEYHAVAYYGQSRDRIATQHLLNRKMLQKAMREPNEPVGLIRKFSNLIV